MNRRDLVKEIAAATETDPKTVTAVLDGFQNVTLATVAKGDPVVLTGFAKFAKVKRAARMGRNPATGEPVKIKASTKAKITPLKGFKDVVSGATPAPKMARAVGNTTAKKSAAPAAKVPAAKKAATGTGAATAKKAGTATGAASGKKAAPAAKSAPARNAAPAKKATTAKKSARGTS